MQEVSERYQNLMASIKPAQGKLAIPFFSSVTGRCTLEATCLGPSYWRSNMESPVLFLSAVESAFQAKDKWSTALEIGPHSTLSGPFRQICQALGEKVNYTNTLARGDNCTKSVLIALGHLFCQGLMPRLSALNPPGVTMSNLPSYPWNHDTSYWHESRISRQFRTREFPEHELLGARVTGGTDLEPSWRKLLDVNHVSWLNDHVVSGDVIFPGAGYIALIGEAIRQLSKSSSYTIRNCSIGAAMILRDGQSTEIITRLRTRESQTKLQPSTWYDFSVSSYDGNKWHHHVNGEVHTGQNSGQNMVAPHVKTIRQLKSGDWYRTSRATGLEYGPSFRLLQNIRCAVGHPVASANVYNDMLPKGSSYAIHPIAIDNFLQCCIIAPFKGHLRKMNKLVLPIHIDELHVRAQEVHTDLHLRGAITSHNASSLSASGQIQTLNGSAVLQCENIQFRTLDNNTVDTAENSGKQSQHLLEWKPDIDLIDANKLLHRTVDLTSCIKLVEELSILCSIETARVLKNIESSVPHLRRFKEWIDQFVTTIQQDGSKVVQNTSYMFQLTSEERQPHIRRLLEEALDTPAKDMAIAITRMYNAAEDIFRGNMEPLAVLLADDVLTRLYNFLNTVDHEQFLQLLGHGKPNMRILEIGAGTGGFTSTILPALSNPSLGHMFGTYTYTDISSGFFKAAKERFREYPNLEFAVLDISQDLQTQGVEQHGYDLVVAANVSIATPTHSWSEGESNFE
jgi:acyl transferase domain-containing protein